MKTTGTIFALLTICVIGLFVYATGGYAATINVADYGDGLPSKANFELAYAAATTGDTIIFPLNGSATWTSGTTIGKALTIYGQGTTLTSSGVLSTGFFRVTGFTSTDLMRITGFIFNAVDFSSNHKCIRIDTITLTKLRIDHNTFHYGYDQIDVGGSYGVIDNNYFYNSLKGINFTAGTDAQANASWESMTAGTANALFIESNHFIDNADYPKTWSQEKIGTRAGGKLVVRYNDFNFDDKPAEHTNTTTPFMAHGSAAGGVEYGYWQIGTGARRGQSVIEFYNNTMQGYRIDYPYISRGSANLIYNNAIVGRVKNAPRDYLREEERYVTSNWPVSRTAWPAEDQVHNTFIWNNTYNGSPYFKQASHFAIGGTDYIQIDRDFYLHAPCGGSDATDGYGNTCTHGKETFTGANGATDTYPTDGNTYPTLGTMTFTPTGDNAYYEYTPYKYPHPLTSLAAPSGLRLITP